MERLHSSERKGKPGRNSKGLVKQTGRMAGWEDPRVLANLNHAASSLRQDWPSLPCWCFLSAIPSWPFIFLVLIIYWMHGKNVQLEDTSSSQIIPYLCILMYFWASLVVKNLPAMWETWVLSLGWEDPVKNVMATHSSIFAWRNHVDREAWGTK